MRATASTRENAKTASPETSMRKLADLTARLRLILNESQPDTSNEQAETQALSNVLYFMALQYITRHNLSDAFGFETERTQSTVCGSTPASPGSTISDTTRRSLIKKLHEQVAARCGSKFQQSLPKPDTTPVQLAALEQAVELSGVDLKDPTALGFAYQFFRMPRRKQSQARIQTADKGLEEHQIISFTQLYTPGWVAEFLLTNTVTGRCNANVLDPACGAGHFLVPAFNLLAGLNRDNPGHNVQAANKAIANVSGTDIDAVALHVATLSLFLAYVEFCGDLPDKCWARLELANESVLGSLDRKVPQNHILNQKYAVVVTNPPYIGRKLMSREQKVALKAEYPECAHDLCAPFVVRAMELLKPDGKIGFITQSSILSLPSYAFVREKLCEGGNLDCVVELGPGIFPLQSGEKVNSSLLIASANNKGTETTFIDVTGESDKQSSLTEFISDPNCFAETKIFQRNTTTFSTVPFRPFHYRCPPALLELLPNVQPISTIADVRQGLATTDNKRFLRYWWQVPPEQIGTEWIPYVKGAGTDQWSSPLTFVINWANNGAEIKAAVSQKYPYLKGKTAWVVKNEQYYFRPGLCFSFVSTDQFAVRLLPEGCIFDVAASAIFSQPEHTDFLLAYLNSALLRSICKLLNPTINMQVGDVKRLPLLSYADETRTKLASLARRCCEIERELDHYMFPSLNETEHRLEHLCSSEDPEQSFQKLRERTSALANELAASQEEIDSLVFHQSQELQNLSDKDRLSISSWVQRSTGPIHPHPITQLSAIQAIEIALVQQVETAHRNGTLKSPALLSPAPFKTWTEKLSGIDFNTFLQERFNPAATRYFRNTPPFGYAHRPDGTLRFGLKP